MVNAMYIWRPIANSEGVCTTASLTMKMHSLTKLTKEPDVPEQLDLVILKLIN